MMASLPQIGSGQLMVNGDVRGNSAVRSTLDFDVINGVASRRNSVYPRPPSIVTVGESLPSIHDSRESQRRKSRSRSHDPALTDGAQLKAKRRRENDSRSKSLDPRAKDVVRTVQSPLSESDEENDDNDTTEHDLELDTDKSRKVRFNEAGDLSQVGKFHATEKETNSNASTVADARYRSDKVDVVNTINKPPQAKTNHNLNQANNVPVNSERKDLYKNQRTVHRQVSKKPQYANIKDSVHVYSKKYQIKNWTETNSDPGPGNSPRRSIDNDHFVKGRPADPRRPGFARQQGGYQPKNEDRPRAAERGKRQQFLPSQKDTKDGELTARSVNSAPSKEREAPVPQLNTFMSKDMGNTPDKDVSTSGLTNKQALDKAKAKDHSSKQDKEAANKDKVLAERDKAAMREKVRKEDPKENSQKDNESNRHGKESSPIQARSERHPAKRDDNKTLNLPADDHGPAYTPTITDTSQMNHQSENENFNYYASADKSDKGRAKTEVPPLQLYTKTPTEKSFSTRILGSDDMHLSSVSPTKSEKSRAATDDSGVDNKKKREVTIIDPRDLKMTADEIAEEAYNKEYEYAHNELRRTKDFEEMDEEEKIEFFKSEYRMKPEQIRELTFHPRTNEPKIIHKTYTGIDAEDWTLSVESARVKSGRQTRSNHRNSYRKITVVPTYQRKDFMLSRLQGKIYRHISKVYGNSPRDNREKQFYEKLAQIQLEEYRRRYEMLEQNERKRLESLFRQREQLKQLRKKFEKDAWKRFMTQYVTSKVVESEYSNRKDYGLPNSLDSDFKSKMRRKDLTMDPNKDRVNKKKFETLFKFSTGPNMKVGGKPLKFEGFDSVYIDTEDESGQPIAHRQDVSELIKEARLLLKQTEMEAEEGAKPRVKSENISKHPSRPVHDTRNRMERPRHHRSRERQRTRIESDKTPPRRSKSRSKTPKSPKTIKDVILRRQSHPGNRYKMSEFLKTSIKPKAPTTHQNLSKPNSNKTHELDEVARDHKPTVKEKTEKTVEVNTKFREETTSHVENKREQKEPLQKSNSVKSTSNLAPVETVVVSESQQKTDNANDRKLVEDQKRDNQERYESAKPDKKPHLFLEETETLIGTSRDYDANSPVKNEIPKHINSRSESPVSKDAEPLRPASKASILTNQKVTKSQIILKEYNPASRRGSKASTQIQSDLKSNSGSVSPYKQPVHKRTPSVASVMSKTKTSSQQISKTETKTAVSNRDNDSETETSKAPGKKVFANRTNSRSSIHTINSVPQHDAKLSKPVSKTSMQMQNVVEKVVQKELKPAEKRVTSDSPNRYNSKNKEIRSSLMSLNQATPSPKQISTSPKQESPTPKQSSEPDSRLYDKKSSDVNVQKSYQDPAMKKTVHISESVHTTVHDTEIANGKHDSDGHHRPKHGLVNGFEDKLKPTNQQTLPSYVKNQNVNSSTDSRTEQPSKSDNRGRIHAPKDTRTPRADNKMTNGHEPYVDSKVKREEFENRRKPAGHARQERKRSPSSDQGISKSRERKRSSSKERKPKQSTGTKGPKGRKENAVRKREGQSRFPDIVKNDKKNSHGRSTPKTKVNRAVHIDEMETETIRTVTPSEKQGAAKWKDLVQKYMREPSPIIGKTEDRSVLQTKVESDTDESEADIFERARRKYALDVDDDDDDSDD